MDGPKKSKTWILTRVGFLIKLDYALAQWNLVNSNGF
jgi:hypothetical protein